MSDRYARLVMKSVKSVLDKMARELDSSSPVDSLTAITSWWQDEVDEALAPEITDTWRGASNDVLAQLQRRANQAVTAAVYPEVPVPKPAPDAIEIPKSSDELAADYLRSRMNHLVALGDDIWEVVRDELIDGLAQGESIDEMRDRVVASTELARGRAERVARTEVVSASNAGALAQIQSTGFTATKEWLATSDDRTRDDHRKADGQVVALNEMFNVGGVSMERPGDGPSDQVVNCRCTMVFDIEDEDLMPSINASLTAAGFTTGMIALIPSDEDLDRLALDGGEPRDELHLTLWFLGEASQYDEANRQEMIAIVTNAIHKDEEIDPIVLAHAFGVNYWNPNSDDPAWVLAVGDRQTDDERMSLTGIRGTIGDALDVAIDMPEQHSPWVAHVTLGYGLSADCLSEMEERLGDITFDRVRLAFGDEVHDVQLRGNAVTLASATGGSAMPWSKSENHSECPAESPWAVVNDETGELVSCHETEQSADDAIATLYASEDEGESEVELATNNTALAPVDNSALANMEDTAAWAGVIVVEGTPTGDGREFVSDALTWAELPIPLRWNMEDSHGGVPQTVAVTVGRIDEVWRDGNQILARGVFDLGGENGKEAHRLVAGEFLKGVSVDLDDISDADIEFVYPEGEDDDEGMGFLFSNPEKIIFHGGRIRAATLCDIPAFVEAYITLDVDSIKAAKSATAVAAAAILPVWDAIAASAEIDDRPPREWFDNPKFSVYTPIIVTDDGRVYGHAAPWDQCHIGYEDMCVSPPFEEDRPYFMTGEVVCADNSRVAVGQITVGTGHASLSLGASRAAEHYDNTGSAVADVVVGNDSHGIWVAGSIRPHAEAARVRDLRASGQVSGDWRRIGGHLRMVGLLAVNVPGFPVPKLSARVASGSPLALVAAGRARPIRTIETEEEMNARALRVMRDRLVKRINGGGN